MQMRRQRPVREALPKGLRPLWLEFCFKLFFLATSCFERADVLWMWRRTRQLTTKSGSSAGRFYINVDCGHGPYTLREEALEAAKKLQEKWPSRKVNVVQLVDIPEEPKDVS